MNKQPLILRALWGALGATAYIALLATIFSCRYFHGAVEHNFIIQITILLLLVFSVLVMGVLLLLAPLRLYLDGQKQEGVRMLLFTLLWVGVITVLALAIIAML